MRTFLKINVEEGKEKKEKKKKKERRRERKEGRGGGGGGEDQGEVSCNGKSHALDKPAPGSPIPL